MLLLLTVALVSFVAGFAVALVSKSSKVEKAKAVVDLLKK